ncbi:PepSY domain-containing protein [Marinactinospora rubrisoli]|uniref:PepSY domain-containing protein n=1 Tax=Marinactinospora rubrisoli TaxID=2715399 RepID=A0ABW2KFZ7_9ACTN
MTPTRFGRTPLLIAGGAALGVIALGAAGLAVAATGGLGTGGEAPTHISLASDDGGGDAPAVSPASDNGGSGGDGGGTLDLLAAAERAAAEVPDGIPHDVEFDDGVWEVDVVTVADERDHEFHVDPDTGEVTPVHEERADAEDLAVADVETDLAAAVRAAEEAIGGPVTELQFEAAERDDDGDDREDAVHHWEAEGQNDREAALDATNGEVLATDD